MDLTGFLLVLWVVASMYFWLVVGVFFLVGVIEVLFLVVLVLDVGVVYIVFFLLSWRLYF